MVSQRRHARTTMSVRMILLLLSLVALAVMPVRAASIAWLHQQPARTAVTDHGPALMAHAATGECPLHATAPVAASPHKAVGHDGSGNPGSPMAKGAGSCCVAWCASPALPVELIPIRFPPPPGFTPPSALPGPDGRNDSPPLRPPRA